MVKKKYAQSYPNVPVIPMAAPAPPPVISTPIQFAAPSFDPQPQLTVIAAAPAPVISTPTTQTITPAVYNFNVPSNLITLTTPVPGPAPSTQGMLAPPAYMNPIIPYYKSSDAPDISGIGGTQNLEQTLAIGNSAGVYDIDMSGNNIDNVNTISSDFLQNINILGYKDINITTQVGDVNIEGNDVNINMTKVLLAGDTYLNINSTDNIRLRATGHIDISANVMNVYNDIDMHAHYIRDALNPVLPQDVATKHYVDSIVPGAPLNLSGVLANGNSAGAFQIDMSGNKIINVATPTNPLDAVNKAYVDAIAPVGTQDLSGVLAIGNSAAFYDIDMSGNSILNVATPVLPGDAVNKAYVDALPITVPDLSAVLVIGNSAGSSQINMNNNKIVTLAPPTAPLDAVNKAYVDALIPAFNGVPATAEFISLTTQNIGNATPTTIAFSTVNYANNISLIGGNTIQVLQDGLYQLAFSAQLFQNGSGNNRLTFFWLNKNGIDISNSNSAIETNAQLNKQLPYVSYILDLSANDAIKLKTQADTPIMQLLYEPAPLYGTEVPSIIVSIERLNNATDLSGIQNLQQVLSVGNSAGIYQIDMSGNKIINVATPTNPLDAVNKAYVDAIPSGIQDLSGVLAIGNNAGTFDINMNQNEINNVSKINNIGNQLDIEASDVNITSTGLSVLDIQSNNAIQLTAGTGIGILATGAIGIGTLGVISIGSTNTGPGGYTTIEHYKFIDEAMSSNTANKLTMDDISGINTISNTNLTVGTGNTMNVTANTNNTTINAAGTCLVNGRFKVDSTNILGGSANPNAEIRKTPTAPTGFPTTLALVKDEAPILGLPNGEIVMKATGVSTIVDFASIQSNINLTDGDSGDLRFSARQNGTLTEIMRIEKDNNPLEANTGLPIVNCKSHRVTKVSDPIMLDDAMTLGYANANYADISGISGLFLPLAGGTMSGTTATINNLYEINGVPGSDFYLNANNIDISAVNNVNIYAATGNINAVANTNISLQAGTDASITAGTDAFITANNRVVIDSLTDIVVIEDVQVSTNNIQAVVGGPLPVINLLDVSTIQNSTGGDINMSCSGNTIISTAGTMGIQSGDAMTLFAGQTVPSHLRLIASDTIKLLAPIDVSANDISNVQNIYSAVNGNINYYATGTGLHRFYNNNTITMDMLSSVIRLYRPLSPTTILDNTTSPGTPGRYLGSTGTGVAWSIPPGQPITTGMSAFSLAGSASTFIQNGVQYTQFTFDTPGTYNLNFTSFGSSTNVTVDMLIIGGGAGGSYGSATVNPGGSGCGCAMEIYNFPLNQNATLSQTMTVIVGAGGLGATTPNTVGGVGSTSSVSIPAAFMPSAATTLIDAPGGRAGSVSTATPVAGITSTYTLTTSSGTSAVVVTPTGGNGGGASITGGSTTRNSTAYNFNMSNRNGEAIYAGAYNGGGGNATSGNAGAPGGSARSACGNSVAINQPALGNGLTTYIKGGMLMCCQGSTGATSNSGASDSNTYSYGGGRGERPGFPPTNGSTYGSAGGSSYSQAPGNGVDGVVIIRYRS